MSTQIWFEWTTLRVVIAAVILLMAGACAPEDDLRLGMSQEGVVQLLGEPSREAVLIGKVLRDIDRLPAEEDPAQFRLVYFYDKSGLQVWFEDGKVTGATRNGISMF
jgi:hypothetical protein